MHPFATVDITGVRSWAELDAAWSGALAFPADHDGTPDAWLDIMSSLDEIGMTGRPFEGAGAILIEVLGAEDVGRASPELLAELVRLTAQANRRYRHSKSGRGLALVFMGRNHAPAG